MKRKLVQMGKHCLMTAIPSKWLKQQGLTKGDSIEFQDLENYLILSGKPIKKEKKISIQIDKYDRTGIIRVFQSLYDSGYTELKVRYSDKKALGEILYILEILDGWRIIKNSGNECTIVSVERTEEKFDNLLRKAFMSVEEHIKIFSRFFDGEKDLLEEIQINYKLILKQTMDLKRMMNTSHLPLEYKFYYFICIQFEEIVDHYEYLLRRINSEKIIPKNLFKLNKKIELMFEKTYTNFYKFDLEVCFDHKGSIGWRDFATKENSLFTYHLRAISERIKNILNYAIGIKVKD